MNGRLFGTVFALALTGCAVGTSDPLPAPPPVPSDNPGPAGLKSGEIDEPAAQGVTAATKLEVPLQQIKQPDPGPGW